MLPEASRFVPRVKAVIKVLSRFAERKALACEPRHMTKPKVIDSTIANNARKAPVSRFEQEKPRGRRGHIEHNAEV